MSVEQLARKNVEAAIKRFLDRRVIVNLDSHPDWPEGMLEAADEIRNVWKPSAEELLARVQHRLAEYHGPPGEEPVGMDIIIWHMEQMARDAFRTEMQRRNVPESLAEYARRRLTLEKWKG